MSSASVAFLANVRTSAGLLHTASRCNAIWVFSAATARTGPWPPFALAPVAAGYCGGSEMRVSYSKSDSLSVAEGAGSAAFAPASTAPATSSPAASASPEPSAAASTIDSTRTLLPSPSHVKLSSTRAAAA